MLSFFFFSFTFKMVKLCQQYFYKLVLVLVDQLQPELVGE